MSKFTIDFKGSPFMETSQTIAGLNRLNWRAKILLTQNKKAIEGKRILDLASHDGRFSYACLKLGAKHVTGVEGRDYLVKHAQNNLKKMGCRSQQFRFVKSDLFDYLAKVKPAHFDTILCFGFLYHTIRQVEFFGQMGRIKPEFLMIDTIVQKGMVVKSLAQRNVFFRLLRLIPMIKWQYFFQGKTTIKKVKAVVKPPAKACLTFFYEDHRKESNTINPINLTACPTPSFIEMFLKAYGFKFKKINWHQQGINSWRSMRDYQNGRRAAWVANLRPVIKRRKTRGK